MMLFGLIALMFVRGNRHGLVFAGRRNKEIETSSAANMGERYVSTYGEEDGSGEEREML
jgi:hypothetical protein